ncbi:MAG TPA: aspartate kinase [Clostridiaceae bacterium]|jgi:aspartate kinase|nr:aspartate kinase [Clostridiaceae bacterium]
MKVAKFGGSSLASAEQVKKVCNIITSDLDIKVIVVSAPGKRYDDDIKVTDLLIACAESYMATGNAEKECEAVIARFDEIGKELGISDDILLTIAEDIKRRLKLYSGNRKKFLDVMKAAGEDNCARLVAGYLQSLGNNAHYINPKDAGLILSNEYGNAQVLPESYENLKSLKDISGILIFPGFFGYSKEGDIVTFPRGGSDITGSILAAALDVELYENFTDVDCVYSVNPHIISNPIPIYELTYSEMRELSYAGFSIFHEEALVPVYHKGIPVRVKNTNNPDAPGTTILPDRTNITRPVVGIASDDRFCCIHISKYLMNREIGFGRKVLKILEDENVSYDHIPSGIDHMSVVLNRSQMKEDAEERIIKRIKEELSVDEVTVMHDLALIMIVGEGMNKTVGLAARATRAFARAGVNIEMINQGISEISIMFGVKAKDSIKAVKSLYEEFFGE